jgi:hypothetical protein
MPTPRIAPEHAELNRLVADLGVPAAGNGLAVAAKLRHPEAAGAGLDLRAQNVS